MRLLQLSDIHYRKRYEFGSEETAYQSIFRKLTSPPVLLDQCLEQLGQEEKNRLDAVLISGDLTEDGTAEDYAQLRVELERRFPGIPIVVTMGNHDDKAAFRQGWLGQAPDDSPFHQVVRIGDLSILALDNAEKAHRSGIIDGERCDWLRQAAEREKGRKLVLMMHHHLIAEQAAFPACEVDPEFSQVLREIPVTTILCGHTHQLYRGVYADLPYRTTLSMSFIGEDREHDTCMRESCGFSLYSFENGEIRWERHEVLNPGRVLGYVRF